MNRPLTRSDSSRCEPRSVGSTRLIFQDRNEEYTYVLVDVQPAARKEVEVYAKLLL